MTSIEWLIDQLVKMDKQLDGRRKNEDATILKINPTKLFEQTKEMHKAEIIAAYMDRMDCTDKEVFAKIIGEQYYQKTFKQD